MPGVARWERRLQWLWCLVAGTAVSAMQLGVFWWWGVFIVTIPVLFAATIAPTLLIYVTTGLLPWLMLRRWRWPVAAVAAIGSVALVAIAAPMWLTAKAAREAATWTAGDREAPAPIRAGDTVALLASGGPLLFGYLCGDAARSRGCRRPARHRRHGAAP